MDWKPCAIQRLKNYEARKQSLGSIKADIEALEMQFTAIRPARTDGTPASGGTGSRREDMMISNIQKRSELEENYRIAEREVISTENGMSALTEEERRILYVFYMNRPRDHVGFLSEELCVEKSEVYRRKDAALKKFTIACYGVNDV